MKKTFYLTLLLLIGTFAGRVFAADIGAELPLEDQASVDGWSGIQVRFGEELPAGEAVTIYQYYADDDREANVENGEFSFAPLIVQQEDGSTDGDGQFTIFDVGPVHTPEVGGAQVVPWGGGSVPIPDDGNLYHVGWLEWNVGAANNAAGGLVSFGEAGSGMHFFDVDTSAFTPDDIGDIEPGFDLSNDSLQIHSSPAPGRNYQVSFTTSDEELPPPGDFNNDGSVDFADFTILSANYNMTVDRGTNGDINYSGGVDFKDFVQFRSAFESLGGGAGEPASVPEPVAGMLGLFGVLSTWHFVRRRRREV